MLEQDKICKASYFVCKGCMRMYFIDRKGTEQTTQFALENWWISDYNSLENKSPANFYIQTIEASEVIILDKDKQEELLLRVPKLEKYFRLIFLRAYAASQYRIKLNHEFSREEQYHHFNSLYPDFIQRIPQYMLASYLGFTPEFLSKIRGKKAKSFLKPG